MKDYASLPFEEKEALVKQAMDRAWQIEYDYGNCIQSVLCGLMEAFPDMGLTPDMVKASFGQRRKTLFNALKPLGFSKEQMEDALRGANVDAARRGETLSLAEFAAIANNLAN